MSGTEASKYFRGKMSESEIHPKISIILIGDDVPSQIYVKNKLKFAKELGVEAQLHKFDANVSQDEILNLISDLNHDKNTNGMIVQLPVPEHLDRKKIVNAIDPKKDIDGLHQLNYGNLILNENIDEMLIPATPFGITLLLDFYKIDLKGKHCVILGRGLTVGKALDILLSKKKFNATCTLCHTQTKEIEKYCQNADVLISAMGSPLFVKNDMIKDGAVVIDVGINRIPDETKKNGVRLVGDVDFENVKEKCSFITPVPGGVGPMTITALLWNAFKAYKIQHQ